MTMKRLRLAAGFACLASLTVARAANADLIALTVSGGTTNTDYSGSVGYSFTVGASPSP